RLALATVEVLDEAGEPVPYVWLWGTFTGAAYGTYPMLTDRDGIARFVSPLFEARGRVVGFQVDAAGARDGFSRHIDRPRGFVRIDSRSLELLAAFAGSL